MTTKTKLEIIEDQIAKANAAHEALVAKANEALEKTMARLKEKAAEEEVLISADLLARLKRDHRDWYDVVRAETMQGREMKRTKPARAADSDSHS